MNGYYLLLCLISELIWQIFKDEFKKMQMLLKSNDNYSGFS